MSNPPVLQVLRPLQKAFHVGHHWRGLTRQFSAPPAALCTYLVRTGVRGRGRARVRCSTSALTEATTAGPVWRSTVGTATRGVLPPPVGACTSTLRRGGLATGRPAGPAATGPGPDRAVNEQVGQVGRPRPGAPVGRCRRRTRRYGSVHHGRAATGCRVHAHTGRPETCASRDQSMLDRNAENDRSISSATWRRNPLLGKLPTPSPFVTPHDVAKSRCIAGIG